MEREVKVKITRVAVAAVLLVAAVVVEHAWQLPTWQLLLVYLVPYLIAGYDVIAEAVENVLRGELFDENFLMAIATVGALAIGFMPNTANEFPEAVFVMLFFQVGEVFECIAEGKSRRSISALMDIRPDTASVERGSAIVTVAPSEVKVGEIVVIKPGEKVPMDGVVVDGASSLNTVALTGESVPRDVKAGDDMSSGCVNLSGVLRVRVTRPFGESTASKIIDLVEHASENKSRSETFIARFAKVYTPIVVFAAIAVAVAPPLLSGDFTGEFAKWLYRALTFLIVSCPCALVISVPLTFFGGIGGASRRGVLVKGSNYLEAMAKLGVVVFDKTGTLTKGVFQVRAVHPEKINETQLLHLAAHVEQYSTHPIAVSLRNAYPRLDDGCKVEGVEEIAGKGVKATVNGRVVSVGNSEMMDSVGAKWHNCTKMVGTIVHVAIGSEYVGHIVISDVVKDDASQAVALLKNAGVQRTVMLTGDHDEVAREVAQEVGVDEYHAQLLPADKVTCLEQLLACKPQGTMLAMVGDGINDAPVLARADVGIAMGGMGSDAAIEAADVVIMDDKPSKIAIAIRIAKRTLRIANENVVFSIGIKALVLVLAFVGVATMWMAVFADVGVTVLAVLNAMRALR